MDITIIGTGNMARGIATRALEGGHGVTLLGTEQAKAEALAAELPGEVGAGALGDPLRRAIHVIKHRRIRQKTAESRLTIEVQLISRRASR